MSPDQRCTWLRYCFIVQAVDFLNLRLGIVHGDVCPWNLLIDEETDDLKVPCSRDPAGAGLTVTLFTTAA